MSLLAKSCGDWHIRVTDQASFILPSPLGFIPVVTSLDVTCDAAAVVDVKLGGTRASLAVNPTGSNNEFTVRSLRGGDSGEGISVEVVENGNNTALSVVTTVNAVPATGGYDVDIVVNVATDGSGNGTSTAKEVIDAINADTTANLYVEAYPTTSVATTAGVIDSDVAVASLAGATPSTTDAWQGEFEAAFVLSKVFPPGALKGSYGGDDVRVAISAGTDRELTLSGFYIPGALQSVPTGVLRSPAGLLRRL